MKYHHILCAAHVVRFATTILPLQYKIIERYITHTQIPTKQNPNFNAVAQNYVCGPEIYFNNTGARRRTLAVTIEQPVTIMLANDSADECYSACYNKLAPNNNAFVFNLYPVNGSTICTCCRYVLAC